MNAQIFLEDFVNGAKIYNNFLETAPGALPPISRSPQDRTPASSGHPLDCRH